MRTIKSCISFAAIILCIYSIGSIFTIRCYAAGKSSSSKVTVNNTSESIPEHILKNSIYKSSLLLNLQNGLPQIAPKVIQYGINQSGSISMGIYVTGTNGTTGEIKTENVQITNNNKVLSGSKINVIGFPPGGFVFDGNRAYQVNSMIFDTIIIALFILVCMSIILIINIYKRKKVEKKIEFMAYHDSLTGINNRQSLIKMMDKLCSTQKKDVLEFAVMFIDLDNFKAVNDTVGHDFGDEVLVKVSEYIKDIIPDGQFFARIGGDEFVVLLIGNENIPNMQQIANAILKKISIPISKGNREFFLGASIGIALYPEHSASSKELLKKADISMYTAKSKGKNRFEIYNDSLETSVQYKTRLEEDLHNALLNEEFELYYQPKLNTDGSILIGAEALIRWNHPVRGIVPPDEFIPLAEETGLIVDIGKWVLESACKHIVEYKQRGIDVGQISINASPRQFQEGNFVELVMKTLKSTGVDPGQIGIEITESWPVNDFDNAIRIMSKLKQIGVDVFLDDFGTGYSSINYLRNLPISAIKIDRSFAEDIGTSQSALNIVMAIISLAHTCNLKVVAEGVENYIQKSYLVKMGCDEVQGYYYSKPLKGYEFENFITSFKDSYALCNSKEAVNSMV